MTALKQQPETMTFEAFLAWEARQQEKWELIDGVPRLRRARMMAGGTRRHARISGNVVRSLGNQFAGGRCGAYTSDLKVRPAGEASRYPDVTVDCGGGDGRELTALDPRMIVEVISP